MILYHVTPVANIQSIRQAGISPVFSQGKKPVCWYVSERNLVWAIAHVSTRHRKTVNQIVVYQVRLPDDVVKRTAWVGVYTCADVVMSSYPMPATVYLDKYLQDQRVGLTDEQSTPDENGDI